jgi:hypothetical protein
MYWRMYGCWYWSCVRTVQQLKREEAMLETLSENSGDIKKLQGMLWWEVNGVGWCWITEVVKNLIQQIDEKADNKIFDELRDLKETFKEDILQVKAQLDQKADKLDTQTIQVSDDGENFLRNFTAWVERDEYWTESDEWRNSQTNSH